MSGAVGEPPVERRCTATSHRTGEQCQKWAITGGTVCITHGGRAPQVRAAANRRVAQAKAAKTVAELADKIGPVEQKHPIDQLLDACDRVSLMVAVYGTLVDTLSLGRELAAPDHAGDLRPHTFVVEYRHWLALQAETSKRALDAGVDERRVRLGELQAERLFGAVQRALERSGMTAEVAGDFRVALAAELRAIAA